MFFNLGNLFDIEGIVYDHNFLDFNHLGGSLFLAKEQQAEKGDNGRHQHPYPPGNAFLLFRRNISIEILQTETTLLTTAGGLLEVGHYDAVLLGPCHKALKAVLGPHGYYGHLLTIAHLQEFILRLEKPIPISRGALVLCVNKVLLDTGVRIQTVRECFADIFQFGVGIHHHIGVYNAKCSAVLGLAIDSDTCAGNISLRCFHLGLIILLFDLGLFCFWFLDRRRSSLFKELG